jgi:WD40 repeat protein
MASSLPLPHATTVRLWDARTGKSRGILKGHSHWIDAVAFSPDGQFVASASWDKTVRLWDLRTGVLQGIFIGHSDSVYAVAFSPDGLLVASTSRDETVRLWDARTTGISRGVLKGHSSFVKAVAFSPDGQLVASASWDKTVRLWDARTGTPYGVLKGHTHWVEAVAFSPDDQFVASASPLDKTVRLWNIRTEEATQTLDTGEYIHNLCFSSDGSFLETNRGQITLSSGVSRSSSNPLGHLYARKRWVPWKTGNVLWLPHDYQAECLAVRNNVLALGDASGRVTFIEFNPAKMPAGKSLQDQLGPDLA